MRIVHTALVAWVFLAALAAGVQAQTTAFTYQGLLKDGGAPANGSYDFKFELYDASTGGTLLGSTGQTLTVSSGIFTASLDYGNDFPGANRWLAISVRPTGGGNYTPLTPRQALQPAPYAIGLEMPFTGATGSASSGLTITNSDGAGLAGTSANGPGVSGLNDNGTTVDAAGVYGQGTAANGNGVAGIADQGPAAYGVYGESTSGWAGFFYGNVFVLGNLSKSGGSFKIDDPLDPANKYLYHSFVESPDMKDVYDGVVTTGADGLATVALPDWFQALNRDFRYQLTVIDDSNSADFVQAKIVARVNHNQFTLRTSKPQTTVSWQVTGIRQDPWANAHRIPVEEDKPGTERGRYLHPELYGAPAELSVLAAKAPAAATNRPAGNQQQPVEKAPIAQPSTAAPGTNPQDGSRR